MLQTDVCNNNHNKRTVEKPKRRIQTKRSHFFTNVHTVNNNTQIKTTTKIQNEECEQNDTDSELKEHSYNTGKLEKFRFIFFFINSHFYVLFCTFSCGFLCAFLLFVHFVLFTFR